MEVFSLYNGSTFYSTFSTYAYFIFLRLLTNRRPLYLTQHPSLRKGVSYETGSIRNHTRTTVGIPRRVIPPLLFVYSHGCARAAGDERIIPPFLCSFLLVLYPAVDPSVGGPRRRETWLFLIPSVHNEVAIICMLRSDHSIRFYLPIHIDKELGCHHMSITSIRLRMLYVRNTPSEAPRSSHCEL